MIFNPGKHPQPKIAIQPSKDKSKGQPKTWAETHLFLYPKNSPKLEGAAAEGRSANKLLISAHAGARADISSFNTNHGLVLTVRKYEQVLTRSWDPLLESTARYIVIQQLKDKKQQSNFSTSTSVLICTASSSTREMAWHAFLVVAHEK